MFRSMEEDLELLRSMYLEGTELTIEHLANKTRLTFNVSLLEQRADENFRLVIDVVSGHDIVSDVKLKSSDNRTLSLDSESLGIRVSEAMPSVILEKVMNDISNLRNCLTHQNESQNPVINLDLRRIIYKLDHMRNENRYKKNLQKFAKQTGCFCLLYNTKQGIRVVLEGEKDATREFLKLNKTSTVDVDSTGLV